MFINLKIYPLTDISTSGLFQFIIISLGILEAFFPDDLDSLLSRQWLSKSSTQPRPDSKSYHWPTDFTADIQPVACHSHNDYWRKKPLFSAIEVGCSSVEADVWLFDDSDELYVGHSVSSLTADRTLNSLYIDPLLDILSRQNPTTQFLTDTNQPPNGVFDTDPTQPLVLLVDFKTNGATLWPVLLRHLEPLRQRRYLTHFNGTHQIERVITIVATGNAPFDILTANHTYRDVFFDAPLDLMASISQETHDDNSIAADNVSPPYTTDSSIHTSPAPASTTASITPSSPRNPPSPDKGQGHSGLSLTTPINPHVFTPLNSHYASTSFRASIGYPWSPSHPFHLRLSPAQLDLVRRQIAGAHNLGLKVRYWNTPSWPRGLRDEVWRVLVREGVDVLSADEIGEVVKGDWGWGRSGRSGWWR